MLMWYSQRWLEEIIPFLRSFPYNGKYAKLCDINTEGFTYGWKIGEDNPENKQLNMRTYGDDMDGVIERLAVAKDATADLCTGKMVSWKGRIDGKMPTFVRDKKICPISGEVLLHRVIRDASCGTAKNPSLNMLTPDSKARMTLPSKRSIASHMYIMYLLWGRGCYFAKTDMSGAFRQFYLAISEPSKIVYDFDGRQMADFANIWGTRSGSKICQDLTDLVSRYFNLKENGTHLASDINRAVEELDVNYFLRRLSEEVVLSEDEDEEVLFNQKLLWRWNGVMVQRWLRNAGLSDADECLSDIQNGPQLIAFHYDTVRQRYGEATCKRLQRKHFFTRLIDLKLQSKQLLTVIADAYVDDFMFVMLPHRTAAARKFGRFGHTLTWMGVDEKESKRQHVNTEMDMIGLEYNTVRMSSKCPDSKREAIKAMLYKAVITGALTLLAYESLIGKLQNVAEQAWPAKAFLRRMRENLLVAIAQHGRKDVVMLLDASDTKDFKWWIRYMDVITEVSILDLLDPVLPTDEIFFDGATNGSRECGWEPGIGVWYQGHWISSAVPEKYLHTFVARDRHYEKEFAIAHFEMLAIIVGLHNFRAMIRTRTKIMLKTDSRHVESALKNKNSDDEFLQSGVRWVCMYAVEQHVRLYVSYVHTKSNPLADAASRLNMRDFMPLAQAECRKCGWVLQPPMCDFEIPDIHKW